ncbi:hypothetical protein [Crocinitomix catalasitica]|uniref:hypothetical protein n=1 Tax=Crocinitomix catalasitica TaxID=184607 RepID=UPI000489BDF5|nr:hypothetical protein [Crocinitomix catalasitica]
MKAKIQRITLVCLFLLLKLTTVNGQELFFSDGIGEIDRITYKNLIKSIGEPDTLIKTSFSIGKVKPNIKVIYGEHDIIFNFFPKRKLVKQNQPHRLKSIEISGDSKLKINDFYIHQFNLTTIVDCFGVPTASYKTDDGQLNYTFQLRHKRISYTIHSRFKIDGSLIFLRIELNTIE